MIAASPPRRQGAIRSGPAIEKGDAVVLRPRPGTSTPETIRSPATALTIGSAIAALIATVVVAVEASFEAVFGEDANSGVKAAVLIAIVAAWALIAAADIVGRAIAKAAAERVGGEERAAAASAFSVSALPTPVAVAQIDGVDSPGFLAVASRVVAGEDQVLLVKAGTGSVWIARDRVRFGP
jgi:hypothetical protein